MLRILAVLFLISASIPVAQGDDLPRGVVNSQDPKDIPLTPAESLNRITVPKGFHVTLFAGEPDLRRPIAFDFDDRGRLWVVENYSHPVWKADGGSDRILILEDTDNDGRFDKRTVFWDKGRYLTGIAVGHGGVWIANTPELAFIPDRDRNDIPDSKPIAMLDGFQISKNNVLNNFHWGPDGWLYGALGLSTPSFVGAPGTPKDERTRITRGIWRFHPIHHKFESVAEGMVNPWGADFNEYGDLFTANTVTAHLWHIVPGMYCQRRAAERDNPYAYGRIQSIANHLHWGGGVWQSSRETHDHHSVAGGGHAHCGGMVYLGDNWPKKYRGTFFTNNLHGNRVNNDRLVPKHSSYVGVHADDFLFGNDLWFRGMSIKYGPDGGVYVSDWHDIGECHDSDGSHRSSGRIFKVVYGKPKSQAVDLQRLSALELAELHQHANDWFTRHARRILHERAMSGQDISAARKRLRAIFKNDKDELQKLRAMWTLFVMDEFEQSELVVLLKHDNQHVRRWAVRFLVDQGYPGAAALTEMTRLARDDDSPKVRLALASALQRLKPKHRWNIAKALMSHAEDAEDHYLPLMIWYGIEPLVNADNEAALKLATYTKISLLRRHIARRTLDVDSPPTGRVVQAALRSTDGKVRLDFLAGMFDALNDTGGQPAPASWAFLYRQVAASSNPALRSSGVRLATIFGDKKAIAKLRQTALNKRAATDDRLDSFRALLKLESGLPVPLLHELITEPSPLRRDAIQALVIRNEPTTAKVLLGLYPRLNTSERQDAIGVLGTRQTFAVALLTAIEKDAVNRRDVSAFALQQLRSFSDAGLRKRIDKLWADDAKQIKKSDEIARYKQQMTPDYLKTGSAAAGRLVFEKTCAKCHTLFGDGATIGPDLTGSGRKKIDYVLSNLVDPNAVIDPKYRLTKVLTTDGRLFSGFVILHDDKFIELRTQEARVKLSLNDVEELRTSKTSMMPEGMLRTYSDEQVRDLLLYLASDGQVPRLEGGVE
ncbi:MAG: c-type cytochrome [Planctomycetaceae bacterium]|nr:c-type cytochrome [Planctomycetaceae bacterium]MBT6156678.1 c-type cytochrome [Planctomycetaceae bacterium]MBT6494003.1 c-type cytochrome [Planctomycetaceae bacterium]